MIEAENPVESRFGIGEALLTLAGFSDRFFGEYAFLGEPLKGRLNREARQDLIEKAEECGRQCARDIVRRYGPVSPAEYAGKAGLAIRRLDEPGAGGRAVFAQFVEPDTIEISRLCAEKASSLLRGEALGDLFGKRDLEQVLIAHEVFHYLEMVDKRSIFTRTERIVLWSLGPFQYRSGIACLGEIAGMAFAKEIVGLPRSPFLLDVLFLYTYSPAAAESLYHRLLRLRDALKREKAPR